MVMIDDDDMMMTMMLILTLAPLVRICDPRTPNPASQNCKCKLTLNTNCNCTNIFFQHLNIFW